ncbi:MAG: hypothetical protein RLY43_2092 [Bacteroidota bacterium]
MKKNYTFILLFLLVLGSFSAHAQESKSTATSKTQEPIIEGLTIYPNPTSGGKIYISSKLSLDKKVEIFNVLGKKVLETIITSKEVNVSQLTAGVYIIKIKEGEATATRKLIIN